MVGPEQPLTHPGGRPWHPGHGGELLHEAPPTRSSSCTEPCTVLPGSSCVPDSTMSPSSPAAPAEAAPTPPCPQLLTVCLSIRKVLMMLPATMA